MSHLERDDAGTRGMQRIFRAQLDDTIAVLSRRRVTDEQVHEARKQLKRSRATLRLLRDQLGKAAYARENGALRDAARPLGSVRDARVLPEVLDSLISRYGRAGRAVPIARLQHTLRRTLVRERGQLTPRQLSALATRVQATQRRSSRWRVGRGGWTVLGAGLGRTYRRGREAFAAAHSRATPDLHEWRKQVKYLRYQLHLLEPLSASVVGELADRAHELTEYLGEDHDLAVLEERVHGVGARLLDCEARGALLAIVQRRRRRLQDKAFAVGRRIYAERPQHLRERFGEYWREWRENSEPAGRQGVGRAKSHGRGSVRVE
jgi:CHAD domain-containing protein